MTRGSLPSVQSCRAISASSARPAMFLESVPAALASNDPDHLGQLLGQLRLHNFDLWFSDERFHDRGQRFGIVADVARTLFQFLEPKLREQHLRLPGLRMQRIRSEKSVEGRFGIGRAIRLSLSWTLAQAPSPLSRVAAMPATAPRNNSEPAIAAQSFQGLAEEDFFDAADCKVGEAAAPPNGSTPESGSLASNPPPFRSASSAPLPNKSSTPPPNNGSSVLLVAGCTLSFAAAGLSRTGFGGGRFALAAVGCGGGSFFAGSFLAAGVSSSNGAKPNSSPCVAAGAAGLTGAAGLAGAGLTAVACAASSSAWA